MVLGRDKLDLSDHLADYDQIQDLQPDLIINAAAYTAVDLAETELKTALSINAIAAGMLADQARELGIPLIHSGMPSSLA